MPPSSSFGSIHHHLEKCKALSKLPFYSLSDSTQQNFCGVSCLITKQSAICTNIYAHTCTHQEPSCTAALLSKMKCVHQCRSISSFFVFLKPPKIHNLDFPVTVLSCTQNHRPNNLHQTNLKIIPTTSLPHTCPKGR